jgi:PncC family amidohydrolase
VAHSSERATDISRHFRFLPGTHVESGFSRCSEAAQDREVVTRSVGLRFCGFAISPTHEKKQTMQQLVGLAERISERLRARGETVAVAESSAGGLIAAALLAVPGASAYFLGGAVVYTRQARRGLLAIADDAMAGIRPASEPYAALLARTVRERHGATWGLAETGATGPTGNRYGDPAGHACIGLNGPTERVLTIRTGSADRQANMRAFATEALETLLGAIAA